MTSFICPICKTALRKNESGSSLVCEKETKPHCFDISSAGYVNLDRTHAGGGDSKECVRSRSAFLSLGHYLPISEKINELLWNFTSPGCVILDAGCGEGYYTNAMSKVLSDRHIMGIDISKSAVEHGARSAKREKLGNISYAVASIFELPIDNISTDAVTSIFAPCPEKEFARVLKDGGMLIIAAAGERHLMGLKSAIYDNVYTNEERADMPYEYGFTLIDRATLSYNIHLKNNDEISNLFAMTPYFYRTSAKDKEKLSRISELDTEIHIEFSVYRKNG